MGQGTASITFPIEATVTRLGPVREDILKALETADEVALDLGKIQTFDLGLVQLLLSARQSAKERGKELLFPAMPNLEMVKMTIDLGIARPDGVGDEWPW